MCSSLNVGIGQIRPTSQINKNSFCEYKLTRALSYLQLERAISLVQGAKYVVVVVVRSTRLRECACHDPSTLICFFIPTHQKMLTLLGLETVPPRLKPLLKPTTKQSKQLQAYLTFSSHICPTYQTSSYPKSTFMALLLQWALRRSSRA